MVRRRPTSTPFFRSFDREKWRQLMTRWSRASAGEAGAPRPGEDLEREGDRADAHGGGERAQLLHRAAATMSLGLTISDPAGRICYINHSDAAMHGWSPEDLIGQPAAMLGVPGTGPEQDPPGPWVRRRDNVRRDGSVFPALLRSDLVRSHDGSVLGTVTTTEDLTERVELEQRLLSRERLLAVLADSASVLFGAPSWEAELDATLGQMGEALGARISLLDLRPGKSTLAEAGRAWLRQQLAQEDRAPRSLDPRPFRVCGGRCAETTCTWTVLPIRWSAECDGALSVESDTPNHVWTPIEVGALQTAARITAALFRRDAHEVAMAASAARYQRLVEQSLEMIQSVDTAGRFLFVNRAWRERLGYGEEDLAEMTVWDVVAPDHHEACRSLIAHLAEGGASDLVELEFRTAAGELVPAEGVVGAQFEGGRFVGSLGFFRDVSSRLEVERLKDDLLTSISHELRTPLASILAALELTQRGEGEIGARKMGELLEIADRNAKRLNRLVSGLLELQAVRAGRLALRPRVIDARAWMVPVTREAAAVAQLRGVRIELDPRPSGVSIVTDPQYASQVLGYVLAHATRASTAGDTLTVAEASDGVTYRITVEGERIAVDLGPRDAAQPFLQLGFVSEASSGLELATAAELAQRLGARLDCVQPPVGRAQLVLSLPLGASQVPPESTQS